MNITVQRNPENNKYVMMFDASVYKTSNCARRLWYNMFRGLTTEGKDFKMEYGTAFHKALEVFYDGGTMDQMVQVAINHYMSPDIHIPDSEWRSPAHLANCVMQYYNLYKPADFLRPMRDKDGKIMTERRFSFPFIQTKYCEVLLTGTIDMLAYYMDFPCIVDHKTTSLTQVDTYLATYELSPQLMMYRSVYDAWFPESPEMGCVINGIFLSKSNRNNFKRSPIINYTKEHLECFKRHLRLRVMEIIEVFESALANEIDPEEQFLQNFTCCEEKYGMCAFTPVCLQPTKMDRESIIANTFTTRVYDPRKFQT